MLGMRRSATLLLGWLLAGALLGQVSPPVGERGKAGRGLTPAASFALSEIETVNLVNGNLLLRLPAGLAAAGTRRLLLHPPPALQLPDLRCAKSASETPPTRISGRYPPTYRGVP